MLKYKIRPGVYSALCVALCLALAAMFGPAPELLAQDGSYTTKVYTKQGGETLVIASGGTLHVETGATVTLDAGSFCSPASDFTLDDGAGASPALTFQDGTDETSVFAKVDAGFLALTTVAGDGLNVLVGNLKIGNGSPGVTQDGEDAYVEGTLEVDGAVQLDSTLAVTGGAVTLQNSDSLNTGTDAIFDLTRNDAGTVSLTASDNDSTAALTVLPGGAAALGLGGASTTATTLTTDGTGDAEVVLPENSVGPDEVAAGTFSVILCGQLVDNSTSYLGPSVAAFQGSGADTSAGGTVCDALDSTTEATADAPIFTSVAFKVTGMYCRATDDGAAGVVFTLRSAAAGTTPAITCTASGGGAANDCRSLAGSTTDIAAGATIAVAAASTEDLSTQDGWCMLFGALK